MAKINLSKLAHDPHPRYNAANSYQQLTSTGDITRYVAPRQIKTVARFGKSRIELPIRFTEE